MLYMYNRVGKRRWIFVVHIIAPLIGVEGVPWPQTLRCAMASHHEAYRFDGWISSYIKIDVKENRNRKTCTEPSIQTNPRILTSYYLATPHGAHVSLTNLYPRLLEQLPVGHKPRDLINTLNTKLVQQL